MTYTGLAGFTNPFIGDTGSGGTEGLVPAPAAGDAAADKFLKADGTWVTPSGGGGGGGVNSIGAIDSQPGSNDGAVIDGSVLYMQSASYSSPGLMNTGSQGFSGPKSFDSSVYFNYLNPNGITYAESTGRLNNSAAFNFDSTNFRLGLGTITPGYDIHVENNTGTTDVFIFAKNSASSGSQDASIWATVSNLGTGDAYFCANDGNEFWSFGLRKSSTNSFMISPTANLSSPNPFFMIDSSGSISNKGIPIAQAALHLNVSPSAIGIKLSDQNEAADAFNNQVGIQSEINFFYDTPSNVRGISLENYYTISALATSDSISSIYINATIEGSGSCLNAYGIFIDTGISGLFTGTLNNFTNLFVNMPSAGTNKKAAALNGTVTIGNDYSIVYPASDNSLYVENSVFISNITGTGVFNIGDNSGDLIFQITDNGSVAIGGITDLLNCLTIKMDSPVFNQAAISLTGTTTGSISLTQRAIDINAVFVGSTTNCHSINNQPGFSVGSGINLSLATVYNASPKYTGNAGTIVTCYGYRYDGGGSLPAGSVLYNYGAYFSTPSVGSFARIALYSDNLSVGYTTVNPATNSANISGQLQVGTNSTNNNIRTVLNASTTDYSTLLLSGTLNAVSSTNSFGLDISTILSPTSGSFLSTGAMIRPNLIALSGQNMTYGHGAYIKCGLASNVGTISNFAQLYIDATTTSTGAITNSYGLYVAAVTVGSARITAAFGGGISVGATNLTTVPPTNGAIFQGNVGINSTAASAPLTIGNANVLSGEIVRINGTNASSFISFYNNTTFQGSIGTGFLGNGISIACATSTSIVLNSGSNSPIIATSTSGLWVGGGGGISSGHSSGDFTQESGYGYFKNGISIKNSGTQFTYPIILGADGGTGPAPAIKIVSNNAQGARVIIENNITSGRSWAIISNGASDTGGVGNLQITDQSAGSTGNLYVTNTAGYMGLNNIGMTIGSSYYNISPPNAGLQVQGRSNFGTSSSSATSRITLTPSTGDNAALTINGLVDTISGSNLQGILLSSTISASANASLLIGLSVTPTIIAQSTRTVTNAFGIQIAPVYSSNAGTITTATNLFVGSGTGGAGTITTAYGLWVKEPTAGSTNICAFFEGEVKFGTNTTGAGSALLGSNCPAITTTAPYTWITAISSDGSTVYIPAWK